MMSQRSLKMFTEWIERKKRKRNCKVHFGSDSIKMKDCIVAPVHMILDEIYDNQELDFYVLNLQSKCNK